MYSPFPKPFISIHINDAYLGNVQMIRFFIFLLFSFYFSLYIRCQYSYPLNLLLFCETFIVNSSNSKEKYVFVVSSCIRVRCLFIDVERFLWEINFVAKLVFFLSLALLVYLCVLPLCVQCFIAICACVGRFTIFSFFIHSFAPGSVYTVFTLVVC